MTGHKFLGSLGDCTVVILTDAESRLLREFITDWTYERGPGTENADKCLSAFNAGIARGTARLQQEAKDEAARKKREGK